jgi:dipeptidyl aminopeptidase/acylaminoacyl peptidase
VLKSSLTLIELVLILAFCTMPAKSQTVFAKDGNIFITEKSGQPKRLTTSGRDSEPRLSLDGKRITFVRGTPGRTIQSSLGEVEATELWLVNSDGTDAELLLSAKADSEPQKNLGLFNSPQFSPDGLRVYFTSIAWVTSSAVHAVEMRSKAERFISAGNTLDVVQRGRYRGYLVVQMHKYFRKGGSYDDYWLLDQNGKELRYIGGEISYRKFKNKNMLTT